MSIKINYKGYEISYSEDGNVWQCSAPPVQALDARLAAMTKLTGC